MWQNFASKVTKLYDKQLCTTTYRSKYEGTQSTNNFERYQSFLDIGWQWDHLLYMVFLFQCTHILAQKYQYNLILKWRELGCPYFCQSLGSSSLSGVEGCQHTRGKAPCSKYNLLGIASNKMRMHFNWEWTSGSRNRNDRRYLHFTPRNFASKVTK